MSRERRSSSRERVAHTNSRVADPSICREIEFAHPTGGRSGSRGRSTTLPSRTLGALLCFDMANIRYVTATHIGTWAIDKLIRFCLLPQGGEPIMWDFGSAARHHKLYNPWLGEERSRASISTLRGSVAGRAEAVAEKIRVELGEHGRGKHLGSQPRTRLLPAATTPWITA
jgi:hypothetical protein